MLFFDRNPIPHPPLGNRWLENRFDFSISLALSTGEAKLHSRTRKVEFPEMCEREEIIHACIFFPMVCSVRYTLEVFPGVYPSMTEYAGIFSSTTEYPGIYPSTTEYPCIYTSTADYTGHLPEYEKHNQV